MNNIEKSVGAVVFDNSHEKPLFLVLKRSDKSFDFWEFPKGHCENRETEIDTLKREMSEEINIKNFRLIEGYREEISYISTSTKKKRVFVYYLITPLEKISLSDEHTEFKWVTVREAESLFEYKDMVNLLKEASKFLTKND